MYVLDRTCPRKQAGLQAPGCVHGISSHVRLRNKGRGVLLQGNLSHSLAKWAMTACLYMVV